MKAMIFKDPSKAGKNLSKVTQVTQRDLYNVLIYYIEHVFFLLFSMIAFVYFQMLIYRVAKIKTFKKTFQKYF